METILKPLMSLFHWRRAVMGSEEPEFSLEGRTAHYDIRNYVPLIVAEIRFNSPFQLWSLRRNEVWIEVAP